MITKHIYSGKSSYNGEMVIGQLIIINGHYYIAEENELDAHSFYAVNPEAFIEVSQESIINKS